MVLSYKTVKVKAEAEITVKKSRFIATVSPVQSQDEALMFIEETKKKYRDASHNCMAYRVGIETVFERRSDDGEPSGTAGTPILEVLRKENVTNTAAVITRYFGGILLGGNGLVRAYSAACAAGTVSACMIQKNLMQNISVTTDYSTSGKLGYEIASNGFLLKNTLYDSGVTFFVAHPPELTEWAEDFYMRISAGKASFKKLDMEYIS